MLVLGVSAGASGARAVLAHSDRPHREPMARCDVRRRPGADVGEPVMSAIRTLRAAAVDQGDLVGATAVTLRTGIDPFVVENATATTTRQHVRVFTETSAQLRYLRFTGLLPRTGTVALYDVGSSGLSLCVADSASGEVLASRRSAVVGGDQFDRLLQDHVAGNGIRLDLAVCRDVKERLAAERLTTVADPDTGACTVVTNNDLAALVRPVVAHSASLLRTMATQSRTAPSLVVLLGGGAGVPSLQAELESALRIPVAAAPEPAAVSARGAVILAAADSAVGTRGW
ncbi:molecular chaperone HscA [Rhodococcus tukisamuensis]|uniref:Molecular chaperone HscA n=2 Tax=Rhodococcus tukisamuensis TaxID=168276 RepID=A0A1G7D5T8_9NOCA|nr:molecular chaperone HscA [Rhodococcus tukisamuensis]